MLILVPLPSRSTESFGPDPEARDFEEVLVVGHERGAGLEGVGGNPDVVDGDRGAVLPQVGDDLPVKFRRLVGDRNDLDGWPCQELCQVMFFLCTLCRKIN